MELEVQKFLRAGNTLADLTTKYGIIASINEKLGITALNYNQIVSPMGEKISQECRALILELDTWNVVFKSFYKFFNLGEGHAPEIDWNNCRALNKLDGSLVGVWFYKNEWHVNTKGTTSAEGPLGDLDLTFKDLILRTITNLYGSFEKFTSNLNPDIFYTFELITKDNLIFCRYNEEQLTLIGAFAKDTLQELDIFGEDFSSYPYPIVESYPLNKLEDILEFVNSRDPLQFEGIVVCDSNFNRVKIKNPDYVIGHRAKSHLNTTKQRLELVLSDKMDDILSILPPMYQEEILVVKGNFDKLVSAIQFKYEQIANIEVQKDFALEAVKSSFSGILFTMRNKKVSVYDAIKGMHLNGVYSQYCKFLGVSEKEEVIAVE